MPRATRETCVQRSYGHLGRVTPLIRSGLGSHLGQVLGGLLV
jgi:hypothetical protein